MFKMRNSDNKAVGKVTDGLQKLYKERLLPLEKEHLFHHFYSPPLTDADFSSKPMVLLLGQYSTGKTTFIRHLLGCDYPGLNIGPEPTTDKFVACCHGDCDQTVPGHALVSDPTLPFTQLNHFGNGFLSRFECAKCNSPALESITLIDTPGVLAGEKQRVNRGYEFESVVKWFADRVDMILVLFDVSNIDISDELHHVILALKGNDHKINIVLNKADQVTAPELIRVYGALMWSLGKVIGTPEVCRVYIGSFWSKPLARDELRELFKSAANELYSMLARLPRGAAVRKLSDLIKRAKLAKVHAYILDALYRKMPSLWGKDEQKQKLINDIEGIFKEVSNERSLPSGDFPNACELKHRLADQDFLKFRRVDKKRMDMLDEMFLEHAPRLLQLVPSEQRAVQDAIFTQVGVDMKGISDASGRSAQPGCATVEPDSKRARKE